MRRRLCDVVDIVAYTVGLCEEDLGQVLVLRKSATTPPTDTRNGRTDLVRRRHVQPLEGPADVRKRKDPIVRPLLQPLDERIRPNRSRNKRRIALGHAALRLPLLRCVLGRRPRRQQGITLAERRAVRPQRGRGGRRIARRRPAALIAAERAQLVGEAALVGVFCDTVGSTSEGQVRG